MSKSTKKALSFKSISELNLYTDKVPVTINNQAQCKQYCTSANQVYRKADNLFNSGDEENAYILYMRYFHIVSKIKKTFEFSKNQKLLVPILKKCDAALAIQRAELLQKSLEERYEKLAASESLAKSIQSKKKSAPTKNDDLILPEVPTDFKTPNSNNSAKQNNEVKNNSDSVDLKSPISSKPAVIIYPKCKFITPTELYELFKQNKSTAESILLIDVRPAEEFAEARIQHPCSINIPDTLLQPGANINSIERRLSKETWNMWQTRFDKKFVVIVDYDFTEQAELTRPVVILADILSKFEASFILYIIVGGLKQWHFYYPSITTNPFYTREKEVKTLLNPSELLKGLTYPKLPSHTKNAEQVSKPTTLQPTDKLAQLRLILDEAKNDDENDIVLAQDKNENKNIITDNAKSSPKKGVGEVNATKHIYPDLQENSKKEIPKLPDVSKATSIQEPLKINLSQNDPLLPTTVSPAQNVPKQPVQPINKTPLQPNTNTPNLTINIDKSDTASIYSPKKPHENTKPVNKQLNDTNNQSLKFSASGPNVPGVLNGSIILPPKTGVSPTVNNQPSANQALNPMQRPSANPSVNPPQPPLNPSVNLPQPSVIRPQIPANQKPTTVTNVTPQNNFVPPTPNIINNTSNIINNLPGSGLPKTTISPSNIPSKSISQQNITPINKQLVNTPPVSSNVSLNQPKIPTSPRLPTSQPSGNISHIKPQLPTSNTLSRPPSSLPTPVVTPKPPSETPPKFITTFGLPYGWEKAINHETGRVYFKDHNTATTHWTLPLDIQSKMAEKSPAEPPVKPSESTKPSSASSKPAGERPTLKRSLSSPNLADEDKAKVTPHQPVIDRSAKPREDVRPVLVDRSTKPISATRLQHLSPVYGSKGKFLTGLKNLGNTCYMNAMIQCLANTLPLTKYFTSGVYEQHLTSRNMNARPGELARELAFLVVVIATGEYQSVCPADFKRALGRFAADFAGHEQQDAHELLMFFMDGLHEDVNKVGRKQAIKERETDNVPDHTAADQAWSDYRLNNNSVIVDLFQGQFRSTVTCLSCHKQSKTFDAFNCLQLQLPKNSSTNLQNCINSFTKPEKIGGNDSWKCTNCKRYREATKTIEIWKLPPVLIIQLKRFNFDGRLHNKIQSSVDFPLQQLNMPIVSAGSKFTSHRLYAVINHYGSFASGHYTAYCENAHYNKWYQYDDSVVREIDRSNVKTSAAYLLFYTAVDFKEYIKN